MATTLDQLNTAGFKLGNYDQKTDSATLYQPGNAYNSSGTRTLSGISKLGYDTSKIGALDQSAFASGRGLANIDSAGLDSLYAGYQGGAANDAASKAMDAANAATNAAGGTGQAPQDAYGAQLQAALKAGTQPGQLVPGVANPYATDASALNTASPAGTSFTIPPPSPYEAGHAAATAAGATSPTTGGAGSAVVSKYTTPDQTNANVDNFLQNNPLLQQTNQQLMDFLHPTNTQTTLQSYIDQIAKDRSNLAGLNTQLMNNKNIITGTADNIRDEVTKAGGFATESQVQALALARNKTLIQQNTQLADLITSAQNAVNTDTTLLGDERQMAQQETQTRMSLLNYQQQNNQFMFNAANDTYKTLMDKNPEGLLASLQADPTQAQRFTSITGISLDALSGLSNPARTGDFADYPQYAKDTKAKGLTPLNQTDWLAKKNTDAATLKAREAYSTAYNSKLGSNAADAASSGVSGGYNGTTQKQQIALETDFKNTLLKEFSARSGTYGINNAKVSQANKLAALFNQGYDAKTGNFNVNSSQYGELAQGLASLVSGSPSGASDADVAMIRTATAKGDWNKIYTFVTGAPANGSTQQIINSLGESIQREAQQAEQDRSIDEKKLIGLAPTDLDPARKDALISNNSIPFIGIDGIAKRQVDNYVKANIGLKFKSGQDVQRTISSAYKVPGATNQMVWEYIQLLNQQ